MTDPAAPGSKFEQKMSKFIDGANSRETSPEIMEAIRYVAGSDAAAERVWEDPSAEERLAVWERVTKNGLTPASEFVWGADGSNWADAVEQQ